MIKNYFKTAWRALLHNRISAFINIGGLAVGMAVALLIGLWIFDELSFNRYHENYSRIARINSNANYDGTIYTVDSHPMPLGTELRSSYKTDFKYVVMATGIEQHVLSYGDKSFTQAGNYMESEAPDLLTLKMLEGTRRGLKDPNSILLSESLSKKLFEKDDPLDKIVNIDNKFPVKVTGVYEDLPYNTDLKDMSFLAPFDLYLSSYDWARKKYTDWNNITINIYTELNKGINFDEASIHIKNVLLAHVDGDFLKRKPVLFLQPMSRWHLYSKFENGVNVTSEQLQYAWFYGIIGVFVLLLACINFMNLSTARSEKRAKEVGIRKTIGVARTQLVWQFFSESLVVAAISFVLALLLVQLSLPWFNNIAVKKIDIPWNRSFFWILGMAFTFCTGLLAGIYPAIYLSSFNAIKVLKGTFRSAHLVVVPRKALVVLQFTFSVILITGTILVYRQLQFVKSRSIGYRPGNLLQVQMNSSQFAGKYDVFKNELINSGIATDIAESASPVTSIWSTNRGFTREGNNNMSELEFATIAITPGYGKTIGWQIVQGRDFSRELASDSSGFVINEAAVELMRLREPIGKIIYWDAIKNTPFKILGVAKNMVMESPFNRATPTIFFTYNRDDMNYMIIKLNPGARPTEAVSRIENIFKKTIPSAPFDYSFVDRTFQEKFATEERTGKLASVFAGLAVFISCLGLFGLSLFIAEQRTKEIGVRKVMGASVFSLWKMLSGEFAALIIIAVLIATPVTYYLLHEWLQRYQYRTGLSWWLFAIAGALVLLIALITVSVQAIKAAMANPVKSLRTE